MTNFAGISGTQLKQYLERIEYLEEQKSEVAADIREVFAEAKTNGFDVKIMRQVLKVRRMNFEERQEQESLLEVYMQALDRAEFSAEEAAAAPVSSDDGEAAESEAA